MTHVAEVSATARHAELYLHAVVARLLPRLSDALEPAPWLDGYRALSGVNWYQEIAELEADSGERLPLAQLSRDDALVLMAAGLIEEDIRFGSLFAALQDPLAARRPCFGLLGWLLAAAATTVGDVLERCQRLAMAGLIVIDNKADPRSEWVARLPVPLWDLLTKRHHLPVVASPVPRRCERPARFPRSRTWSCHPNRGRAFLASATCSPAGPSPRSRCADPTQAAASPCSGPLPAASGVTCWSTRASSATTAGSSSDRWRHWPARWR